jgi:release factor glutamine methyltransferase
LDLCTGSGCIAVSIKSERPGCEVAASDISEDSLRIAEENAANILKSQADSYIQDSNISSISFYKSDLFTDIPGKYNLILSNPPYIPSAAIPLLKKEVSNEPILALDGGTDGLVVIRKIIEDARDFLEPGGRLFIESDPNQIPEIASLYTYLGYDEINVYKDLSDNDRVSGARYLPLVK